MPRPAIYTPEEAKERKRARVRAAVARHAERLASLSPVEQAAYKAREHLGDDFDPYTPDERAQLERIRALRAQLEKSVQNLNGTLVKRYRAELDDNPHLTALISELENGSDIRITLAPH